MNVLIGLNMHREKVYTKFPDDEEVMHCISAKYKDHETFYGSYRSKDELIKDVNQWLSHNFSLLVQDKACIFEPEKEGYYIVAHNSHGLGLEAIGFFFVCDENQLTETSQLSSEGN